VAINVLTDYEKNTSSDVQASQLMTKVFVSTYFNTAIILLLVYGRTSSTNPLVQAIQGVNILAGKYEDFTVKWYSEVGVQLTITCLIASIQPHVEPLVSYLIIGPISRRLARYSISKGQESYVMQHDLNALYVGPRFDVTLRYAQHLNMLFFALTFSAGLPLLLFLALISFALSYLVDRFLLLRFYRRPPQRDERLQVKVNQALPYALFIHLGLACWMYGSQEVFGSSPINAGLVKSLQQSSSQATGGSNDAVADKLGRSNTFPLFLFWVFLLAYLVLVDLLPSSAVTEFLEWVRQVLKRLMSKAEPLSLADNGYTKVFDRPLPSDYTHEQKSPKYVDWSVHSYEDGSSVLRKLKTPTAGGASPAKAVTPSGRVACRKTWEIIKVNALHTYALSRNQKYRDAVRSMTEFNVT
jgi:hypothetical protein